MVEIEKTVVYLDHIKRVVPYGVENIAISILLVDFVIDYNWMVVVILGINVLKVETIKNLIKENFKETEVEVALLENIGYFSTKKGKVKH